MTVYQLGYTFLAENPDTIFLAEGMSIDEEGWVVPEVPGSTYLCLVADGGALSYILFTQKDSFPGEEIFTEELKQLLKIPVTSQDYYGTATSLTANEVEQFALGVKRDILEGDWSTLAEIL